MQETVRYSYRLRPGAQATNILETEWHRCRFLWNEAVHQQRSGRKPTLCKLSKLLTASRSQNTWLREGSQNAQANIIRNYSIALDHSFKVKGRGRPIWKARRSSRPSLEYTRGGFSIVDGKLQLPKMKVTIPIVWSRELPSIPSSIRVFRDSLNHWYVSFVVRRDIEPVPNVDGAIGIDWGVSTTATTTNPIYDLPYQGHRKRCAAELAKAQRKMSRRRRPRGETSSRGYRAAQLSAAKLHKKAARQNTHDARIWARKVVANHNLIAVEDFRPKFLSRSTMARKAADAAIGIVKTELINCATRANRKVVLVPPAYTTMTCSRCLARAKRHLELRERIFYCKSCGYSEDRDRNAARVILVTAEPNRVDVEDVRHYLPSLLESSK